MWSVKYIIVLISCPPTQQSFVANLIKLIKQNANSSINEFSSIVGIWSGTIRRLVAVESKLSIENLCQICSRLNISPFDLLGDPLVATRPEEQLFILDNVHSMRLITSWGEVEGKLKTALQEHPPPSMEAMARQLGFYPPKIKHHFPELCDQITLRYKEYQKKAHPPSEKIRRALRSALKEFPPPSLQAVFRRLGCHNTGYYYYSRYPELCFEVATRFKKFRNKPFNKDKDSKKMEAALVEEPPPSFSEVAKRFRHTRQFIRNKFPELSKAITARYLHYQRAVRQEKGERLRYAIREAAAQITVSGLYVSEARVKEYLKRHLPKIGRDNLFKQALREVKSEMGLMS